MCSKELLSVAEVCFKTLFQYYRMCMLLRSVSLLQACEAWKKEAEDSTRKAKTMEDERNTFVKQRDEAGAFSYFVFCDNI